MTHSSLIGKVSLVKESFDLVSVADRQDLGHATAGGGAHSQSVLKAISLIAVFVDNRAPKTLTEIARLSGMSTSTAYRLLQTLTAADVLQRSNDRDDYSIGPLLLALGASAFSDGGLALVRQVLNNASDNVGETWTLSVANNTCAVVLAAAPSKERLAFAHHVGDRVPLNCSAMGKALLALGQKRPAELVSRMGWLKPLTKNSITEPHRLVKSLLDIRDAGYATDDEEAFEGVRSIAVATSFIDSDLSFAVAVHGPSTRLAKDSLERFLPDLKRVAALLRCFPSLSDPFPIAGQFQSKSAI